MSFPRYPKYKASGVEWLGDVPEHWSVVPFPYAVHFQEGPGIMASDFRHEGVPLLRVSGAQGRWATLEGCNYLDPTLVEKRWDHFRLNRGDLVISASASMGTVCEVDDSTDGAIPYTGLIRLVGKAGVMTKDFVRSMIESSLFSVQIELLKAGTTIQHFGPTHLRQVKALRPPHDEQTKIASFLDRETSKIDGLVGEQRRLIELLKEKRQAVISHAVTKGLNPHAPLKPSGIEWLGDVPEHWRIRKIKQLCYVNDGNHGEEYPSEDDYTTESDGVPFIRGGNLQNLTISSENLLYITQAKNASMRKGNVHTNDILFMNRGEIGKLAMIPSEFNGANLNSQIAYLRTGDEIYARFLLFFLCSRNLGNLIESMKAGSVLTQFPIRDINNIHVPLPPKSEQHQIADSLDQRTCLFDELTAEAEHGIELLQERRTALISAAVTGQIDVRGLAETEAA